MRVLLIDDEQVMLALFSRILRRGGVGVFQATNCSDADRVLQERADTLCAVVADFSLDGCTAFDILRDHYLVLRERDVQIFILTGHVDGRVEAMFAGREVTVLHKPMNDFNAFIDQLKQHCIC